MLLEKMRSTVETDKIRARFDSTESRELPIESKIASPRYQYDSMISMFDEFVATGRIGGTVKSTAFETGDMVWAKVKSYPWWPGQILCELFASASVLASKRDGLVLVAFFGDSSYGWFVKDELVPFDANFDEKSKQAQSKSFVKAVQEAIDESCKRSALGLTCRCRNQDNFRLLDVDGYLAVDVSDYESSSVYSTRQIENARENFKPEEVLDFIKQLAVLPRNIRHESLDFFKKKATVLAYRKAVFEEFDSTYDQAFDDESNNRPVANAQEAATIADTSGSGRSSENPPECRKSPERAENNTKVDQDENKKKLSTTPYKLSKRNKKLVTCGSSEVLIQENKEKHIEDVTNKKMEYVEEKQKRGQTEENKEKHTEDVTNKKMEEVKEKQKRGKTEENKEKHIEDLINMKMEEVKEKQKRGKTEENKERHTEDVTNKKMEEVREKQKRGKTEENKEKHTEDVTNKKMEEVIIEKQRKGKTEENKEKHTEDVTNSKMEEVREKQKKGKTEGSQKKEKKRTSLIVDEGSNQGIITRSQKKLKAQSQTTEGFESPETQPNISVSQPEMEIPHTQVELEPVSASQPESQPINGSNNPPKMTFVEQYFYFMRIGNR